MTDISDKEIRTRELVTALCELEGLEAFPERGTIGNLNRFVIRDNTDKRNRPSAGGVERSEDAGVCMGENGDWVHGAVNKSSLTAYLEFHRDDIPSIRRRLEAPRQSLEAANKRASSYKSRAIKAERALTSAVKVCTAAKAHAKGGRRFSPRAEYRALLEAIAGWEAAEATREQVK